MDALKTKGQMYDQIDLGKIQKSGFDLSHNVKGTGRIGRIIPTRCQEVLPGDRMKGSSTAVVQFEPLAVPMLANMYVRQEHFYVPNRIVWEHWDKFFTGGEKLDYTTPPPSINMKKVLHVLDHFLPSFLKFGISPIKSDGYAYENTGYFANTFASASFGTSIYLSCEYYKEQALKSLPAGVLDLVQNSFDVLDSYLTNFIDKYKNDKQVILFQYDKNLDISYAEPQTYGFVTKFGYCLYLSPDPYESAIAHTLDDYLSHTSGINSQNVFPMTDEMRNIVHAYYNFYRYYIGVSSNLDYLSYCRLTLSDMYYIIYRALIDNVFSQRSDSGSAVSGDLKNINFYGYLSTSNMNVFALRANYAVWYNYYRDQLLELDVLEPRTSDDVLQDEIFQLLLPRQRCWQKDTFTTALTNTGTGNVVVPVVKSSSGWYIDGITSYENSGADIDSAKFTQADICEITTTNGDSIKIPTRFISGLSKTNNTESTNEYLSYFSLDMLDACRRAQKWLQKALIYGNRPQDRLYTSWGVRSLDARLSLPECLATSSHIVELSVNTNNTTIQDPSTGSAMAVAGDKSANAYGYDNGGSFNRFCEEHGLIISYLTILPEATYPYSVKRGHSRMDKFDYPTPEFATLGMDAVYESELCPCGVDGFENAVFGYQGRYFDQKCNQDEEHGELQTTQNMYTFGRQWSPYSDDTRPKLNYEFVHCFPKLDMFIVEDSNSDYFRYDIHHGLAAERALPVCGMYI